MLEFASKVRIVAQRSLSPLKGEVDASFSEQTEGCRLFTRRPIMSIAYIAIGSNLGDKEKNLRRALLLLTQQGVEVVRVSSFLSTEPYGVTDQPQFLNAVACVRTSLAPLALLDVLLATELAMGRVRLRHWGERNIDLDLLLYEDVVLDMPRLRLPHPDMQNRDFVLLPLAEIAPELKHPTLQKTIWELKKDLMSR